MIFVDFLTIYCDINSIIQNVLGKPLSIVQEDREIEESILGYTNFRDWKGVRMIEYLVNGGIC